MTETLAREGAEKQPSVTLAGDGGQGAVGRERMEDSRCSAEKSVKGRGEVREQPEGEMKSEMALEGRGRLVLIRGRRQPVGREGEEADAMGRAEVRRAGDEQECKGWGEARLPGGRHSRGAGGGGSPRAQSPVSPGDR